jgi:hypothetical protein
MVASPGFTGSGDAVQESNDDQSDDGESEGGDHEWAPFFSVEVFSSVSSSSMVCRARDSASRYSEQPLKASPSQADAVLIRSLGMSFFWGEAWQKTIVTSVR